jgi:hypothetical protein
MQPPICKDQSPEKVAKRMWAMFDMYDTGLSMLRCRLRREHADETPEQINERVGAYLRGRPETQDRFLQPSECPRFSP